MEIKWNKLCRGVKPAKIRRWNRPKLDFALWTAPVSLPVKTTPVSKPTVATAPTKTEVSKGTVASAVVAMTEPHSNQYGADSDGRRAYRRDRNKWNKYLASLPESERLRLRPSKLITVKPNRADYTGTNRENDYARDRARYLRYLKTLPPEHPLLQPKTIEVPEHPYQRDFPSTPEGLKQFKRAHSRWRHYKTKMEKLGLPVVDTAKKKARSNGPMSLATASVLQPGESDNTPVSKPSVPPITANAVDPDARYTKRGDLIDYDREAYFSRR